MKWLKHAFAVDPPGPADPTEAQQPVVDWFCMQIAKRHLTTPGLIFIEMSRPLNWVGAQAMHFMRPGVWAIVRQQSYQNYVHFAEFLEHRGSIEYLARRIEHFEAEFTRLERKGGSVEDFINQHDPSRPAPAGSAHPQDHGSERTPIAKDATGDPDHEADRT